MAETTLGTGRDAETGAGFSPRFRMLRAMTASEWRLLLREPSSFFFTLVFPILLLLVFGGVFGNDPADGFDGVGPMDRQVPAYLILIIGTLAIFTIPIQLVTYRETGVLRRLRATPVRAWMLFAAQLLVGVAVTAAGTLLMVLVGRLLFDFAMPARPAAVAACLLVGVVAFGAGGFLLAALCRTARQASLIANVLYFPQLFLSGASFPRELFPGWLRTASEWFPMSQLVIQLQTLWEGGGWRPVSLLYLGVLFFVGMTVSVRLFRWER
ncbi:MAG TPA: ABC transporter permease [Thermomicrobiales bacterium]|nr:ABC transporter permease [Thermomicrobiales bacterium]